MEARELRRDPAGELRELAGIYEERGLPPALAAEVAVALSEHDALAAHARDELGVWDEQRRARPFQAAWTSALSFSAGALLPLLAVAGATSSTRAGRGDRGRDPDGALGLLGDAGARLGGAPGGAPPRRESSPGAPSRWPSPRASARSSAPSLERGAQAATRSGRWKPVSRRSSRRRSPVTASVPCRTARAAVIRPSASARNVAGSVTSSRHPERRARPGRRGRRRPSRTP